MAKVKGSRQDQLIVVPYTPLRRLVNKVVTMVVIIASAGAGYWYGLSSGRMIRDQAVELVEILQTDLTAKTEQLTETAMRVATLEKGAEVDYKANEEIRRVVKDQRDQIAALQEEVALYKGIMTPSLTVGGLTIQELTLDPTSEPNRFRFKIMLTQVGDNRSYIQGFAGVSVIGVENGEKKALLLDDISDQIDATDVRFRYRYFQDIKGELVLPEGFTPEQVHVVAQSSGSKSARVEKYFDWVPTEINVNVGQ